MTEQEFKALTKDHIVLLDGATVSNLFLRGMPSGVCPEQWILEHPEIFIGLQLEYLKAGTEILYLPTFTANRIKLAEYGLSERVLEINRALAGLSKEAVRRFQAESGTEEGQRIYLAGDLTMTGRQLAPIGTLKFEELVEVYREQIGCLAQAGADLIVVETMMSLQECRAALLAAKECCTLPVLLTLTFDKNGRTLYGTDPKTAVIVLEAMGAAAVGVNCSTGPAELAGILSEMKQYAGIPLVAKPNAGLPKLEGGRTVYDMEPEEFAEQSKKLLQAGAGLLGGCCGTTPEHIRELKKQIQRMAPPDIKAAGIRALTTEQRTLELPLSGPFQIIGERINPTGKAALQQELKEGIYELAAEYAKEQTEAGAGILDLNLGMNGIDEKEAMLRTMEEVMMVSGLPLSFDSSHVEVIEAALRLYPGRALINSISMEKEKLERLLPIAKKYGAMFILLPLSDAGLPNSLEEKKQIIRTIFERAKAVGLSAEDILVDGLVNTIGANPEAAVQALETIRYCKEELGLATVCGLSNISFGLPERATVNTAFLTMAIQSGLTAAIANPCQELLMHTALAAELLMGKEEAAERFISRVSQYPLSAAAGTARERKAAEGNVAASLGRKLSEDTKQRHIAAGGPQEETIRTPIYEAVLNGKRKKIVELVRAELSGGARPAELLDGQLIPAINETGRLFDEGTYFLPQLISSAEAMKLAVELLEPLLKETGAEAEAGTVVIATVAGDIHDIGKNLVALMLKNYGFHLIDLGKDVPSKLIVETAAKEEADIIALSALMTTTMLEMKEVVKLRNEAGLRAKIMIGGAVITQDYCDEIGADGYSKDAREAVEVARRLAAEARAAT